MAVTIIRCDHLSESIGKSLGSLHTGSGNGGWSEIAFYKWEWKRADVCGNCSGIPLRQRDCVYHKMYPHSHDNFWRWRTGILLLDSYRFDTLMLYAVFDVSVMIIISFMMMIILWWWWSSSPYCPPSCWYNIRMLGLVWSFYVSVHCREGGMFYIPNSWETSSGEGLCRSRPRGFPNSLTGQSFKLT